jgi:hypothetical protein
MGQGGGAMSGMATHHSCRNSVALPMKLGVANNLIPMTTGDLNAYKGTLQGMSTPPHRRPAHHTWQPHPQGMMAIRV